MTTPEDELREELLSTHPGSDITFEASSDDYFDLLEKRFPVYGSHIHWSKVPMARTRSVDLSDSEYYFDEAESFARSIIEGEPLDSSDRIVVIGDSAMEYALRMSLTTLRSCLRMILRMPQHTYVLSKDASWCMAFTMEGDLCFGRAPRLRES